MTQIEKTLCTPETHTVGGRDGSSRSDYGRLDVKLSPPGTSLSGTWNVLGVLIEFLAGPSDTHSDSALVRGSMRGGLIVPLHSHADQELIYVVGGSLEVFLETHGWHTVGVGEVAVIAGNKKHALRNATAGDVTTIAFTGGDLYNFFRDLAVPAEPNLYPAIAPPRPEQMKELLETNAKYGYWLASPEENAAIGIHLPGLSGTRSSSHANQC